MLAKVFNSIMVRSFQSGSFLLSLIEYWCSPYGLRGTSEKRLRLRRRSEVGITQASEESRICVFVLYSRYLTVSTRCAIDFWDGLGFRVMIVNNQPMDAGDLDELSSRVWCVFERVNMGQDIGAYKDAVLWLAKYKNLDRCMALALTNDSLQFIPGQNARTLAMRIEDFMQTPKQEALFSHLSYQFCRHYQSFFQILKPSVFLSRPFQDFWLSYQPINNRLHCILKGELELSKSVYNHLRHVQVLYSTEALCDHIRQSLLNQHPPTGDALLRLMPSTYRTEILRVDNPALSTLLQSRNECRPLYSSEVYCVADLIENNNPSHVAAFLYPFYLGCPYVKKDLCFAGSFTLAQATNLYHDAVAKSLELSQLSQEFSTLVSEYAEVLQQKGIPLGFKNTRFSAMKKGLKGGFFYSSTTIV
jgi:hypothetical protein